MSKVYKHLHSHTGAAVNPGQFAVTSVSLSNLPTHDQTITITWNSNTRTYKFVNDGSGIDFAQSTSTRPTSSVNIGSDKRSTIMNLVGAIRSNLSHVEAGSDNTFFPVASGVNNNDDDWKLVLYSHAKLNNKQITIGGTASVTDNRASSVQVTGAYNTGIGYTGIMINTAANTIVNVDLLMKKSDCSGRLGPPDNDLEVVTVKLKSGELYEIETYGCGTNCTLFG